MAVESFIKRKAKQTAVYWAASGKNVQAKKTYTTGVEIKCVWIQDRELMVKDEGKETVSKATVYVNQDLTEQGMLYLGTLDDLTSAQKSDPTKVKKAHVEELLKRVLLGGSFVDRRGEPLHQALEVERGSRGSLSHLAGLRQFHTAGLGGCLEGQP